MSEGDYIFKIVIIGDAAVGKTSLINRFVEAKFKEDYRPTLGANLLILIALKHRKSRV